MRDENSFLGVYLNCIHFGQRVSGSAPGCSRRSGAACSGVAMAQPGAQGVLNIPEPVAERKKSDCEVGLWPHLASPRIQPAHRHCPQQLLITVGNGSESAALQPPQLGPGTHLKCEQPEALPHSPPARARVLQGPCRSEAGPQQGRAQGCRKNAQRCSRGVSRKLSPKQKQ